VTAATPDAEELAASVARWCIPVLRFGSMTSRYAALAAGSVRNAGQHHLAVMLYGSSLAESNTARASLRASVTAYAAALKSQRVAPDQATRMALAITYALDMTASSPRPPGDALMTALRADIALWCRDAYSSAPRGVAFRTPPARPATGDREQHSTRQRYRGLTDRDPLAARSVGRLRRPDP
jgi:hypothetical protein